MPEALRSLPPDDDTPPASSARVDLIRRPGLRSLRFDAYRFWAAALVIWGHVEIFGGFSHVTVPGLIAGHTVNIVARCTIPFFLITSGYFLGPHLVAAGPAASAVARRHARRLFRLFVFASIVYFFERSVIDGRLEQSPGDLLMSHACGCCRIPDSWSWAAPRYICGS